jgi:tRNA:m4X modification enzyme
VSFDKKFNLYNLEFNKLEDNFINSVINTKNDSNEGSKQKKHLRQISSIITHVDSLLSKETEQDLSLTTTTTTTLVELGAGRGKLSYWFEQSRNERKLKDNNYIKKNVNILLIERGSQRYKFDSMLKKDVEESNSQFERIRIDLKDIYLNEVPIIKKSKRFLLYGKHLCGIATDYSIRCLKIALEDKRKEDVLNFKGFCLAVCCHHKCEWESLCGKDWLEKELKIDSKLFYIIRSISSWATHGERDTCQKEGIKLYVLEIKKSNLNLLIKI